MSGSYTPPAPALQPPKEDKKLLQIDSADLDLLENVTDVLDVLSVYYRHKSFVWKEVKGEEYLGKMQELVKKLKGECET